jgi:hypothetical protein
MRKKAIVANLRHYLGTSLQEPTNVTKNLQKAVPQFSRLVADFPRRGPGFEPRSDHVVSVADKVAPGLVFSVYFGFPCQFSFHRLLHTHHLSSEAGTIGQLVADVPSGLSLTPPLRTSVGFPAEIPNGHFQIQVKTLPL